MMNTQAIEARLRALQNEIDQLKRLSAAQRLPLSEANIVRVDYPIDPVDPSGSEGDLAGFGSASVCYIASTDAITPHLDDANEERVVDVWNVSNQVVPAGYHISHRMPDGKRVIGGSGGGSLFVFTLNEEFSSNNASADISTMELIPTGITADVQDPLNIFGEMEIGTSGLCILQGGQYWAIQGQCPPITTGT